jgi:ribosome-associated protein
LEVSALEIDELARVAAEAAAEKKAADVVVLRVAELLVVTDYFVIATGANDRQVKVIADEVEEQLRLVGVKPVGREGETEATWILLDFGDLVVHVFQPAEREFYRLEKLWSDAPRMDLPADVVNATRPIDSAERDTKRAGDARDAEDGVS